MTGTSYGNTYLEHPTITLSVRLGRLPRFEYVRRVDLCVPTSHSVTRSEFSTEENTRRYGS